MQQWFQSSFELTGYITIRRMKIKMLILQFQSSFELTGYITKVLLTISSHERVSKLFRAYRLYNLMLLLILLDSYMSFKALSSLQVI